MPENILPRAYDLKQCESYIDKWDNEAAPNAGIKENSHLLDIPEITIAALVKCLFGNSPFLSKAAIKNPQCFSRLIKQHPNDAWATFLNKLYEDIRDSEYETETLRALLRQKKEEAALHIAICDISKLWDLFDVVSNLSDFADLCVSEAVNALLLSEEKKGNIELPDIENPQTGCGLFVLALGKLGAQELNYSSDIDLIVLFDTEALNYKGEKSPQEFAVKITKELVNILDERTADGYVFRTDLRLRPDPRSTAAAVSTEAAELYYESWGQNWERSALIKARVIAGDNIVGSAFLKRLEPFIWRKSLDFYAIQDIHSIKRQIYASKGGHEIDVLGHDIKVGRGGIREIEFFVQIQQLIWGGRNPSLRETKTVEGLARLHDYDLIDERTSLELKESYIFLRTLEHRIQMINDEQTQRIPEDPGRAEAISVFLGYNDFSQFSDAVTNHLKVVERHYANLFEDAPDLTVDGNLVFTGTDHDPETLATLTRLGFANPETISEIIRAWHTGKYRATKSTRSRQILTEIVPNLVSAFSKTTLPDRAFLKFDTFLKQLPAGVQLFSVFYAHPEILDLLADIMGDAPRLADYLNASSERLDYVLDPDFFENIAAASILSDDLGRILERASGYEAKLDACRRWTNDLRFRVGVQALRSLVTPAEGAKALSVIAETTINALVPHVRDEFASQFGQIQEADFAILAYGKLGSSELMPTSDLDLVFIYDSPTNSESSGGRRTLAASVYFMRLTQRIVSALSVLTAEGRLYEIDLRLRPSGDQGPIASSLEAFSKYQHEDAWIWEHLALTKARVVYSTGHLESQINQAIFKALKSKRTANEVANAISEMRVRIKQQYSDDSILDIKHMAGGLMDTEFLVQFHTLLNHERLVSSFPHSSIDALNILASKGLLEETDAHLLQFGLVLWNDLLWLLRLTLDSSTLSSEIPKGLEKRLLNVTLLPTREDLENRIQEMREKISNTFKQIIEPDNRN
ncbi:MAG: bifunctional [glutamine synthetase] adenylyltransferase/[glutamine synthetase]-adenylyl-L-tyrosine phosphorylase [Rhodospirillaceae bacterium]|nr:bifunctional [glutamine synthetase] adenylyltransferase/[glutamine synthetase]-adenylyl-L-tyrosine phosphorylase [Rhodospirillaceae bacterium]